MKCHDFVIVLTLAINLFGAQGQHEFTFSQIQPSVDEMSQEEAVRGLIHRLVPSRAQEFSVTVDPHLGPPHRDTFQLVSTGSSLSIRGTSGVAAAWGFYYYLSQYCGGHISWAGNQADLPARLPLIPQPGVTVTSNDRFRYYQNVCTVSYSFVWWSWTRWEQEIDWMVMNAINLPLAFNAQEAIWQRVYQKMGFTQKELDDHFGGPAFLAWSRMGNMHGWKGPLSDSWHHQQLSLQHQILDRMRAFGMTPVLPAFAGHVPLAIIRLFPNVTITRLKDWGHFNQTYCCTAFLDVKDPLFKKIGKAFVTEYTQEFGTDHVYNTDTFNEMTPASSSPAYLKQAGKAVYEGMTAADPEAIWLMQGWLFLDVTFWGPPQVKALVTSVPKGRMIILDLYSEVIPLYEVHESYYGQPFIWCMLHNFGGVLPMYGVIETVNKGPFLGRRFPNSTMVGTGLTPEGINQNNFIYEFMLENSWRQQPRNTDLWAGNYAMRRYGKSEEYTSEAWKIFARGIYNCSTGYRDHGNKDILVVTKPRLHKPIEQEVWYDLYEFMQGWDSMIQASESFSNSSLYKYDLVDVSRQAVQLLAIVYYKEILAAYKAGDHTRFSSAGSGFLELLSDLDTLLATDDHFQLGAWLETAKSLSTSAADRRLYEYNARTQVTTWGPSEEILDYANKEWSGLVKDYYRPRWQMFINQLGISLEKGVPFNETQYNNDAFSKIEQPFTFSLSVYSTRGTGEQITVATKMHSKYRTILMKNANHVQKSSTTDMKPIPIVEKAKIFTKYSPKFREFRENVSKW